MGLLNESNFAPSLLMSQAFPLTSQYRPDLPAAINQKFDRVKDFGARWNPSANAPTKTSLKGYGWLGLMPTKDGGVMSEFSTEDQRGAYPVVNPLLNRREMDYLLTNPKGWASIPSKDKVTEDSAMRKAQAWAQMRRMQGLDPFID